jgi:serine/threonine protein kinase
LEFTFLGVFDFRRLNFQDLTPVFVDNKRMEQERIGRYQIEKRLGAGSMAVVYKAVDPVIGRTVAIKTIKIDSSIGFEQEELRQRLYREAQSAGSLSHPNIVTIYDIGAEGNVDYIAMEFIEGESLHDWMARNPAPPLQQTVAIIEQIASGLDYAAARGVIHRDIKPANILLTADLTAKIADFGIAKVSTSKFTQTGAVIGSPSYMSPEQAMGRTLDGRSDIFSLGVIFYEMLTGEKPFSGTNPSTIIYKILHEEPVQPQQLNVTLHPAFNEIVGRMLAKDPDRRYQSCAQLIQDLRDYPSLTARGSQPQTPVFASKAELKSGGRTRVVVLTLLFLAAAAAAAGYFYYWKPRQSASQDTKATQTTPSPPIVVETKTQPADLAALKNIAPKPLPDKEPVAIDRQAANQLAGKEIQKPASAAPKPADLPAAPKTSGKEPSAAGLKSAVPENQSSARQQQTTADVSGQAEIRLQFSGASYPVTVYDAAVLLKDLSASNPSIQIAAGNHHFRIVSTDGYIDQKLDQVRLKAEEVYTISVPAVCSAFIDVPNDAYDGCTIQLDGRTISAPYPAQIPKLAAGNHKIAFRWDSGKYVGKELVSSFSGEANHHYRIRGEPSSEKVVVQQIR